MSATDELKPCPFCGASGLGYGIGDKRWHYCPSCGAEVVDDVLRTE